ncbi:MAG: cytochrome c [Gammaproteobacteria bacterium]|nr:cytochrome c [Gammaproteobacteria bacterium]
MYRYLPLLLLSMATVVAHAGDAEAGRLKAKVCAGCHGPDGVSLNEQWPNLAGQKEAYLVKTLVGYRDGDRTDATMAPMAKNLSDEDIADLAAYYANL